ncbi:MAG: pyridoxamine 5'-phosphate oxidase family protein [Candidatus Fonsibacter sp.]|nr:pyridoxamine 5'-phosphate oxidase family protein [Candidatus Fonsibacter sp.]
MNNIPSYYNNIDLILDEIWSLLQRGVADRNEDFRLPVVIVSATDSAEGRIVVLRGAFKDKNILRFHTDFRSSKIKSLKENKKIYFVFYNKKRKIQVRAEGVAIVHKDNEITKEAWTKTQMMSRKCYLSPQAPGDFINDSASDLSKDMGNEIPTYEQSEIGYKNFCVIESKIKSFEWLYLASQGHRRAKFMLDENKSTWLVP